MEAPTTKDSLDEQYPGLADRMLLALEGKLRAKGREVGAVTFKFGYGVEIGPGRAHAEEGSEAARRRWIEGAVSWSLDISSGRMKVTAYAGKGLPECPPVPREIVDKELACFQARDAERARVASLSPGRRQAELDDALGQLRGQPGFVEFGVAGERASDAMAEAFRDAPPVMGGTEFVARLRRALGGGSAQPDDENPAERKPGL